MPPSKVAVTKYKKGAVRWNMWMPSPMKQALDALCDKLGVTQTEFVQTAIREHMKREGGQDDAR
jgi:predicted DNA-binding protein